MDFIPTNLFLQEEILKNTPERKVNYFKIPSDLDSFKNTYTDITTINQNRKIYNLHGQLLQNKKCPTCPLCKSKMHIHGTVDSHLKHLPFGGNYTQVCFKKLRFKCPCCPYTCLQDVLFKADGHNITVQLLAYVTDLLASGCFTLKEVAELCGLCKNIVKEIDLRRLKNDLTIDGETLRKPERQAKYLGIDEFKLHRGYKYATIIVDLETGHILWIAKGKKKSCIYEFMDFVGPEWMDNVVAVACDMNSDYQEAIEERCKYTAIVFDQFHLVKNLNEKVIGNIRKEEQKRLRESGDVEGAAALKKAKYLLVSSKEQLRQKDAETGNRNLSHRGPGLFKTPDVVLRSGYEQRYNNLISRNKLLFTCDWVKSALRYAYTLSDGIKMAEAITEIIETCKATGNRHFRWYARLLENHFEGIVAHADYPISTGKVEGINNKIKTLRRQGYGYPDDEYFFLKLMDMSRHNKT